MGAFDHSIPGADSPDGPVITISGLALMGGVDVKRKPIRAARRAKLEAKREQLRAKLRDELE
jgi:hypothetical protein